MAAEQIRNTTQNVGPSSLEYIITRRPQIEVFLKGSLISDDIGTCLLINIIEIAYFRNCLLSDWQDNYLCAL